MNAGNERQAKTQLASDHGVSEDARKADAFKKPDRAGDGEYENLDQSVSDQQPAKADAKQGRRVWGQFSVRHVSFSVATARTYKHAKCLKITKIRLIDMRFCMMGGAGILNWDDLHTFLAIARQGTLSAAARELGLTQPTMGRRLAALEDRLGARLLQRRPGRYVLTPLGESVLANAERIEAEILDAERRIAGRDEAIAGVVRLTTVDTLAASIVAPALAAVQAVHPDLVVELAPDTRALSLSKREADIALRMTRFEGHQIIARRVGSMALGAYASRDYLARISSGGGDKIITVLEDQAHLPEAKWIAALYPHAKIAFRSNSREVMLAAAKGGSGVAALPRIHADADPVLVRVREDASPMSRDIWLGVHSDLHRMPRVRIVIDAIVAALKKNAERLSPSAAD